MTITVVIVSYFYGYFIANAIDSVLSQTRQPDNILVVDDASHDSACSIAKKMGVDCLERESNLGIIDNFNDILFKQVKTDKLMMLGADNWLRPDALEKLDINEADISSYDMYVVGSEAKNSRIKRRCDYEDGYWIRRFKPDGAIRTHNYINGSALYNAELARSVGGYRALNDRDVGKKDKRLDEDWYLWQQMIRRGKAKHIHISEPLLYYRRHKFNFNGVY